jgi:hypothetical protein
MNPALFTQDDLIKLQFALPSDEWIIAVIPEDGISYVVHETINRHDLFSMKYVSWFRERNANGCHIYGRPNSTRYILIDDLSADAVAQIKQDALSPTVVIETSPDNFQAWITASNEDLPKQVATELGKLLASKYGGDPGSTDAMHLGRLPGLRNKKPKYKTYSDDGGPLVKLRTVRDVPVIPEGIDELIEQAGINVTQDAASSPSAYGVCVPTSTIATNMDIDPSRSPMTEIEANEIYPAELKCQAERIGWKLPITKGLRSDADFHIVKSLHQYYGYDPDDLAALLMFASEKAVESGIEYAYRTVGAAICYFQKSSAAIEEL